MDDSVENVITVGHMFAHLRCKGFGQSPGKVLLKCVPGAPQFEQMLFKKSYLQDCVLNNKVFLSLFSLQEFLKIYNAENGELCHMNINELNLFFKVQDLPNATTHKDLKNISFEKLPFCTYFITSSHFLLIA